MDFILLRDALTEMETLASNGRARPFNLTVVAFDRERKRGGEIIEYNDVVLNDVKPAVPFISAVPDEHKREQPAVFVNHINPNHRENKTRNLRLKNGQVRKIHIRFITHYNSKQIMY